MSSAMNLEIFARDSGVDHRVSKGLPTTGGVQGGIDGFRFRQVSPFEFKSRSYCEALVNCTMASRPAASNPCQRRMVFAHRGLVPETICAAEG
jgi:hypothetical protein